MSGSIFQFFIRNAKRVGILIPGTCAFFMSLAYAQNTRDEFSEKDIPKITWAFKEHRLQFDDFYKGRRFAGEFTLNSITPMIMKRGYLITLKRGGPLPDFYFAGSVTCAVTSQSAYHEIATWQPGNAWFGQLISSRGIIVSASGDLLMLADQTIRAVGGTPSAQANRVDIPCDGDALF